jgi:hypothetical protein
VQGPQLRAAPDVVVPDQGIPGLPDPKGTVSISQNDSEKGQDIVEGMIKDAATEQLTGSAPPSVQGAINTALASGSEKIGDVTSNRFLEKTIPTLLKSEGFSAAESGLLLAVDSEPTAGATLDNPDPVKWTRSALLNVGSVGSGAISPFGDASLSQACNRLQAVYAQTRFNLNAVQQNQVQTFLDFCGQNAAFTSPVSVASPPSATLPSPSGSLSKSPTRNQTPPATSRPPCYVGCNK